MNPDESNPNHFPSDEEPNYIRPVIAIIMVLLLILSVSYTTLQSILQDQNDNTQNTNPNFDIVLTGLSTTTTNCQAAPQVTLGGTYSPSRRLCICGSLYTDESAVNYTVRLRDVQENILERTEKSNQTEGSFCYMWELSNTLEEGRYAIDVSVTRESAAIETIWMTIVAQLL